MAHLSAAGEICGYFQAIRPSEQANEDLNKRSGKRVHAGAIVLANALSVGADGICYIQQGFLTMSCAEPGIFERLDLALGPEYFASTTTSKPRWPLTRQLSNL